MYYFILQSFPPLFERAMFQDLQCLPESAERINLCMYDALSYIHMPLRKFDFDIRQSQRLTTIINNTIEQL